MEKYQSKPIFVSGFSLMFVLLFLTHHASVSAQEVEDEREFDYLENSGKGPKQWGSLKKEWAACKNGDLQSPIDLSSREVKLIKRSRSLRRRYKPSDTIVKNRGHDISLKWLNSDAGWIKINGTKYFLQQAHWHSPSEHTINGRRYAIELHMVHQSKDPNLKNNLAVVGLLYRFGKPDTFLSKLTSNISALSDHVQERPMGVINPRLIKMRGKRYYRYMGSLTVPPCTEGVIWTVDKKIKTVSRDQVRALQIAVHDYAKANARPVQPLNHRAVELHRP